ncbi:MAG: M48 family metallopeptidase [Pseudomonadota bacterium]
MNFFEHQDEARQKTGLLIILFALAVTCIIALTIALFTFSGWFFEKSIGTALSPEFVLPSWSTILNISIAVIVVISCVIFFARIQMSKGGSVIAERLGGRLVQAGSEDPNEQRLLNVVEEMAIAAGLPNPPVYISNETTINAFAAGFNDSDAVIGVTRGTLERLNRDQLQGVVAHEFSHVLHGDMRLNLNLITVLSGVMFISQAGKVVLHSMTGHHHRGRSQSSVPIVGLGLALIIIGYIGTVFGSLIKSAVSRQREYLADASAVQYTRNPEGIAGALKVIGSGVGSHVGSPRAEECSHLFFGDALFARAFGFLSTHPPIDDRIQRIDPRWDGEYLAGNPITQKDSAEKNFTDRLSKLNTTLEKTGFLDPVMIGIAAALLQSLEPTIKDATDHPGSAYALMLALRLHSNPEILEKQYAYLASQPLLLNDVKRYACKLEEINENDVLPLIEMSIPALKKLSEPQYKEFKKHLMQFIFADKKSDLKEWLHFRLLSHYLDPSFNMNKKRKFSRSYHSLAPIQKQINIVISLVAYVGDKSHDEIEQAYSHAIEILKLKELSRIDYEDIEFSEINNALEEVDYLVPLLKNNFLNACAECIQLDKHVSAREWGLLRVIAACIGCPMPILDTSDTATT